MIQLYLMRAPDPHREQSERKLSVNDFLKFYNRNLPPRFPRASLSYLKEFRRTHSGLFKYENSWSLDQHRKKFMDWTPQRTKNIVD